MGGISPFGQPRSSALYLAWIHKPRATHCGGDIVTLLWLYVHVCVMLWSCETNVCIFIKLGRHIDHSERMNPIDFGNQRTKFKVTMDIYGNNLVNMIGNKSLCASSSNLADMLMSGWTLLILEVRSRVQRSMEITLWTW